MQTHPNDQGSSIMDDIQDKIDHQDAERRFDTMLFTFLSTGPRIWDGELELSATPITCPRKIAKIFETLGKDFPEITGTAVGWIFLMGLKAIGSNLRECNRLAKSAMETLNKA